MESYFLSAINPTATSDQREIEALAIELAALPELQRARERMAQRWRTIVAGQDVPAEAWARFDELIEEFAFHYILKAINSDAGRPRICGHVYGPGHRWFGLQVPGSRGAGGDCPDNHYAFAPIEYGAHYELHGEVQTPAPADTTYTLTGNLSFSMTVASLEHRAVHVDAEGKFIITIDSRTDPGLHNHLTSTPDARFIFIRQSRSDWQQQPARLRIYRKEPASAAWLTTQQIATRAALWMVDDVPAMHWFTLTLAAVPWNTITAPFNTGTIGGLVSQRLSFGRIRLSEDDAFVITIGGSDSPFRDAVLQDFWFRTIDPHLKQTSLNNAQSRRDADGRLTYVVSLTDPGTWNWLDAAGIRNLLFVHRWQGLQSTEEPTIEGRLVRLADLERHLAGRVALCNRSEREAQSLQRRKEFEQRYGL